MQKRNRAGHKGFTLVALSTVSLFGLFLGLSLCLVKSPATKAGIYLALADQYTQQAQDDLLQPEAMQYLQTQSSVMIRHALRETPYNPNLWQSLSLALVQSDEIDHAMQARAIAGDLGLTDLPTISALRSLLPARNLALSDGENRHTLTQ